MGKSGNEVFTFTGGVGKKIGGPTTFLSTLTVTILPNLPAPVHRFYPYQYHRNPLLCQTYIRQVDIMN